MADATTERAFAANMRTVGKYAYWILGLAIIIGISYFFYNIINKPIAGVLFFLAGILALYFYYVKWFVVPEKRPSWPPYQTPCPDYLTLMNGVGTKLSDGSYKCFDFVGVSRNGRLKRADPSMMNTQADTPDYYFPVNPKEERDSLKQRVISYGLTWNSLFGNDA
jgi:hypothetical protein